MLEPDPSASAAGSHPASAALDDSTPPGSAAARILVVDDEKVIREILAEFLQLEGYQVATCEDGQRALDELRLRPYDMVISDLKMPRLSGLQQIGRAHV